MTLLDRRFLASAAAAGIGLAALRAWRRGTLGGALADLRACSMPSVWAYDAVVGTTLRRFYHWVASDSAAFARDATVLDVGTGPGHLVLALARLARGRPDPRDRRDAGDDPTGARPSGTPDREERIRFLVADVAALPYPSGSFDLVVSTLSLHHWPDPARGLAEIHRVLRPGGVARIYDVAHWFTRIETRAPKLSDLIAASPFQSGEVETVFSVGPAPVVLRATLVRARTPS